MGRDGPGVQNSRRTGDDRRPMPVSTSIRQTFGNITFVGITGNSANQGGGIGADGGSLWVEDSTIDDNSSGSHGPAVFTSPYAQVPDCTLRDLARAAWTSAQCHKDLAAKGCW